MNIYFSGIGGVAIGPLAEIALDAGFSAQGSDANESLVTNELESRGVAISYQQDGSFLRACHQEKPIDWFVHSAALAYDHSELATARELGIKITKRDELLAFIIKQKGLKLIAVSGTHGKTTTTGMLIWSFEQLGIPTSYSVGTTLSFGPSGRFVKDSKYFLYECDEFDKNFLHFSPYLSLITTIGYDHTDTYPTEAEYKQAFSQFGSQSEQLITWQDQRGDLFADHPNAWLLQDPLAIKLPGAHNRRNATRVLKALEKLSLRSDTAVIESFPGTNRRFEKLADNLYTDYGHHPTEIAATLQMARELSDEVVLVYQPHQNIRQHEIREQYTNDVFKDAAKIYWLPTYLSREDPNLELLSPDQLTGNITETSVSFVEFSDQLWNNIQTASKNGKLVLCMGAGSIDSWVRKRVNTA